MKALKELALLLFRSQKSCLLQLKAILGKAYPKRNVIHRDSQPENTIRHSFSYQEGDRGGQLVLVDFGAAKFATGTVLTRTGTVISTARYVAPEQAHGKATFASRNWDKSVKI
jgi:serine/threonine protein kinase